MFSKTLAGVLVIATIGLGIQAVSAQASVGSYVIPEADLGETGEIELGEAIYSKIATKDADQVELEELMMALEVQLGADQKLIERLTQQASDVAQLDADSSSGDTELPPSLDNAAQTDSEVELPVSQPEISTGAPNRVVTWFLGVWEWLKGFFLGRSEAAQNCRESSRSSVNQYEFIKTKIEAVMQERERATAELKSRVDTWRKANKSAYDNLKSGTKCNEQGACTTTTVMVVCDDWGSCYKAVSVDRPGDSGDTRYTVSSTGRYVTNILIDPVTGMARYDYGKSNDLNPDREVKGDNYLVEFDSSGLPGGTGSFFNMKSDTEKIRAVESSIAKMSVSQEEKLLLRVTEIAAKYGVMDDGHYKIKNGKVYYSGSIHGQPLCGASLGSSKGQAILKGMHDYSQAMRQFVKMNQSLLARTAQQEQEQANPSNTAGGASRRVPRAPIL